MTFFFLAWIGPGYFETLKQKHIGGIFINKLWFGFILDRKEEEKGGRGQQIIINRLGRASCFFLIFLQFFVLFLEWTTTGTKRRQSYQTTTNNKQKTKRTPSLLSITSQCHFARFIFFLQCLFTPFFRFLLLVFLCVAFDLFANWIFGFFGFFCYWV